MYADETNLEFEFRGTEHAPFNHTSPDEESISVSEAEMIWRLVFEYDANGVWNTTFEVDVLKMTLVREEFGSLGDPALGFEHDEEVETTDFFGFEFNTGSIDDPRVEKVIIDFETKGLHKAS